MDTDLATNPVGEQAPLDSTPEVETPPADTDIETPEQGQVDETEEVEHEGKKYRLPKELKGALLRQADYTRKTQELAEARKSLEERQKQTAEQAQLHQANIQEVARLVALDDQLKDWAKVDWQTLNQTDPQKAQGLWIQYNQLKDARANLAWQLDYKVREAQTKAQREAAKQAEENRAALTRVIPEWSPELESRLTTFAVSQGLTREQIGTLSANNPPAVKILHLAYLGQQLIDKQRKAAEPPKLEANPVPQVASRSAPAAKNPEKMTTEEWMRNRNAQVTKQAKR